MVQLIGLIVAAYALARLIQVPFESEARRGTKWAEALIALVSVGAAFVIGLLALGVLAGGGTGE